MVALVDFLNSINITKENILRGDPEATKAYPAFVVSRCLSYHQALIPLIDQLNEARVSDNLGHYEYLLGTIPKGKRFAKWSKPEEIENLEFIARAYECSTERAKEYMSFMKPEQIEEIRASFDEGGAGKKLKFKKD